MAIRADRLLQGEPAKAALLHQRGSYTRVRTLLRCMAKEDENSPDHDKIRIWWQQMHWHHLQSFPTYASDILPTRLGNAIRGSESYPDSQYGIEAITLWPRLVGVVEQEYANAISDSKAPFDFMIDSSVLNAVLCLATSFIASSLLKGPLPRLIPHAPVLLRSCSLA